MIPNERCEKLIAFSAMWKLDGDLLTCRGCSRSLIASRDGERLQHSFMCRWGDHREPWRHLRALIAEESAKAGGAK